MRYLGKGKGAMSGVPHTTSPPLALNSVPSSKKGRHDHESGKRNTVFLRITHSREGERRQGPIMSKPGDINEA